MESKIEIVIPTSEEMRKLGLVAEMKEAASKPIIHEKADANYYSAQLGPQLGKAVYEVVAGRNRSRVKAFENKDFQNFFKNLFRYVEKRAHEMGYFTEDVEFSQDSGITRSGNLVLRLVPKKGARRLL